MIDFPIFEAIEKFLRKQGSNVWWVWVLSVAFPIAMGIHFEDKRLVGVGLVIWLVGWYPVYLYEKKHKRKDDK